ncbi:MAG: metal-sensing transcriptional repressor [Bacilli bacterium]|nr:metal-sensing transcriptional repressor [Bacilli bacterium]
MDCCCEQKKTLRTEDTKKDLNNRISRIAGQMNGIKKMIEEDRYCGDIIIQLCAIDKSIKSIANELLQRHLHTCVARDVKNGNEEVLDEVMEMVKRFQ